MKSLISFLITILIWVGLYYYESANNFWISNNVFFQRLFCWIYLMNAMVLVPARQNSEIIFRITQRTLFELEPGIYFFPFLWWWGEENNPYATNDSSSSFLRIDSAKTFRHRSVGFWEDVGRDFIIPFIFRRNSWSVIICLAMAFFIGKWSVDIKDYLKGDKDIQIEQKINYHPLYDNNTIFKLN